MVAAVTFIVSRLLLVFFANSIAYSSGFSADGELQREALIPDKNVISHLIFLVDLVLIHNPDNS